jgi:hypothetical protein
MLRQLDSAVFPLAVPSQVIACQRLGVTRPTGILPPPDEMHRLEFISR